MIDGEGWHVNSTKYDLEPIYDWETNTLKYGDLYIANYQRSTHGTRRMVVSVISGFTCE